MKKLQNFWRFKMSTYIPNPYNLKIFKNDHYRKLIQDLCKWKSTLHDLITLSENHYEYVYENNDLHNEICIEDGNIDKSCEIIYENPQELLNYFIRGYELKINEIECYINKDKTFDEILNNEALKVFGLLAPKFNELYNEVKDFKEVPISNGYVRPRNNKMTPQCHSDTEELEINYRSHHYSIEIVPNMDSYTTNYSIYCDGTELLLPNCARFYQDEVELLIECMHYIKINDVSKATTIIDNMKECNHKISIDIKDNQSVLTVDFSGRTFNFTDDEIVELLKKATEK